jgi:hypothetical protein
MLTRDRILMTDEDAPLYDFVGVSDVTQGDLQYGGQGNLYPNSDALFLRFRGQPGDAPTEFALKQRGLIWSREKSPQSGDPWRPALDLSLPPHTRDKTDFEINAAMAVEAGFDGAQLPEVMPPAAAAPAVTPPAPVTPSAAPSPALSAPEGEAASLPAARKQPAE